MFYLNRSKELVKAYTKALFNINRSKGKERKFFLDLGIIDPTIGTSNLGDLIIYDSVISHLKEIYPNELFTNYPSQLYTSFDTQKLMSEKDLLIVSGTNLLTSNMDKRYQWKIGPNHKLFLKNKVLLMGVGWWQYQSKPNNYTRTLYKTLFSKDHLHSVRDSYTQTMLNQIGLDNVLNTACPTMWNLSSEHCGKIPTKKADNVVTTLTFYKADPTLDRRMLEILLSNYKEVYLWVQGLEDVHYLDQIYPNAHRIKLVPPSLTAYDEILKQESIEYLGTRLHAGVRALQKGLRTLILAVDNRAVEIAKDTNLNVIKRDEVEESLEFINRPYITNIKLPYDNINQWKLNLPQKTVI